MKKDLHDLLFAIWIDGQTAMIIRDEPGGTHHFELMHNEHSDTFIETVAHKVRYAHTIYILGPDDTRNALQQALEANPELDNVIIQNSEAGPMSREVFEREARGMFSVL